MAAVGAPSPAPPPAAAPAHKHLTELALPFNASRPLHPIAISFVGAIRTLWLPFMAKELRAKLPRSADVFMTVSLSDPTQHANAHGHLARVVRAVRGLQPVHVHVLHVLTCENETARAELTCCDAEKLARAQARGVKLNNATPFTMGNHAHGILSYFHVRQGFREVAAYEARRGKRYDWIVRTRPDVLPLLPLGAELFLQRLDPDRVSVPYKKPGIPGVLADWFFAVPRRLADWFFEVALLGCLKHNEINGGFDVSQRKTCFFGEIYHAPEYLLGPYVKRHLGSPRGGLSDGTGLFPVALMRKRAAAAAAGDSHRHEEAPRSGRGAARDLRARVRAARPPLAARRPAALLRHRRLPAPRARRAHREPARQRARHDDGGARRARPGSTEALSRVASQSHAQPAACELWPAVQ